MRSAQAATSAIRSSLNALRTSGRFNTRCSTSPSRRRWRYVDSLIYILNTPNFGGGIGALNATDNACASVGLVSTGSRMPSSHRRAVE